MATPRSTVMTPKRQAAIARQMYRLTKAAKDAQEEAKTRRDEKDLAYLERNRVVAFLASIALANGWRAGTKRTNIEGWSPEWHNCVYIDLPTGQASWHYHDSHEPLFAHLPHYEGDWDGHSTFEKYTRLELQARLIVP